MEDDFFDLPGLTDGSSDSSDSDEDDGGSSVRSRREKWRRHQEQIRADGEGLFGRVGAEPQQGRKRRPFEAPGSRNARYAHQFPAKDERSRRFDHGKSVWWELIRNPQVADETSAAGRRYRRKFRMPKVKVDELVAEAQKVPKWADKPPGAGHGRGPARAPLVLKVMAALVYLGKAAEFEELEDLSQVSKSTLKAFIPKFVHWLAHTVYSKHVYLPSGRALDQALAVYARLGPPALQHAPG